MISGMIKKSIKISDIKSKIKRILWACRGYDHMIVGFTTTCAISAYHH